MAEEKKGETMKAGQVSDYGATTFSLNANAPKPAFDAESDTVLIKVEACSVNPIDTIVQMGMCAMVCVLTVLHVNGEWWLLVH